MAQPNNNIQCPRKEVLVDYIGFTLPALGQICAAGFFFFFCLVAEVSIVHKRNWIKTLIYCDYFRWFVQSHLFGEYWCFCKLVWKWRDTKSIKLKRQEVKNILRFPTTDVSFNLFFIVLQINSDRIKATAAVEMSDLNVSHMPGSWSDYPNNRISIMCKLTPPSVKQSQRGIHRGQGKQLERCIPGQLMCNNTSSQIKQSQSKQWKVNKSSRNCADVDKEQDTQVHSLQIWTLLRYKWGRSLAL